MDTTMIREMMDRLDQMFQEFDNNLNEELRGRVSRMPVDVHETDESIVVTADMPGVEKDNIDITVDERQLTISATDEREVKEEGRHYLRNERRSRSYQRSVHLPADVDADSSEANYTHGVLTVTLEKSSPEEGSDIEVN